MKIDVGLLRQAETLWKLREKWGVMTAGVTMLSVSACGVWWTDGCSLMRLGEAEWDEDGEGKPPAPVALRRAEVASLIGAAPKKGEVALEAVPGDPPQVRASWVGTEVRLAAGVFPPTRQLLATHTAPFVHIALGGATLRQLAEVAGDGWLTLRVPISTTDAGLVVQSHDPWQVWQGAGPVLGLLMPARCEEPETLTELGAEGWPG